MRICASLSEPDDVRNIGPADMVEVRTDLFDKVPEGIGTDLLVTFRRDFDESYLPKGFSGTVDVGTGPRPPGGYRTVGSYHDYESTPSADKIAAILNNMDADVRKGAFAVNSIEDLVNIRQAADMVHGPHVILGMGELGTVTRIRQRILGNEFTFGYVGEPTAPGQLSVEEMSRLGDDCTILGIFGHPLSKSLSPRMQNRALEVSGIPGIYLKFDDIDVSRAAELIRGYDIRGANVTVPHKETVMDQMDRISDEVDAIGAMNTIVNDGGRLTGRNTDIAGIGIALDNAGFSPAGKSAAILGSGGSARACAYFLSKKGCELTITGRNRKTVERLATEFGAEATPCIDPTRYDLVANCTPIGMYSDSPYPFDIGALTSSQTVLDMVYGNTTLTGIAKNRGCGIASGADILAGQGAASFEMWTGVGNMYETMRGMLP